MDGASFIPFTFLMSSEANGMRIVIALQGTYGDLVPSLALASALKWRGHSIVVASEPCFAPAIQGCGLEHHPLGDQTAEARRRLLALIQNESNLERRGRLFLNLAVHRQVENLVEDLASVAIGRDLVLCNGLLNGLLPDLALRVPETRRALWLCGPEEAEWTRRDDPNPGGLKLCAYSAHVTSAKHRVAEQVDGAHRTGFWLANSRAGARPARPAAGRKPILISLGSAFGDVRGDLAEMLSMALERVGRHGLVVGATAEREATSWLEFLPFVPHESILPEVDAVIHHGGAGTIGAVLHAGLPAVVLPQWADQLAWADTLQELALIPGYLRPEEVTARALADLLEQALSDQMLKARIRDVAAHLAEENGCGEACALLENATSKDATPRPPIGHDLEA